MTDKPQHPDNQALSQESETQKSGNGLTLLALVVGAAGVALGYMGHQKDTVQEANLIKLTQELKTAQQQQTSLLEKLEQTQSALLNVEAVSQIAQTQIKNLQLNEQFNDALNQAIAKLPVPVVQDDVVQLIAEANQNFHNTEKRFGEALQLELGKVQQQHAQSQALLADANELTSKITLVYREKHQALEDLTHEKLQAIARAQSTLAYSAPVENAVKIALSSAEQGNFQATQALLQEAVASFELFNLNQPEYEALKNRLSALVTHYQALSEQQSAGVQFESLLASLPTWQFKAPNAENLLQKQAIQADSDWLVKLKTIGNNALAKTVTITTSSDETISWVNSSANLQAIIRENVQLDLAFLRNALQLNDEVELIRVRDRLIQYINRYFDNQDAKVAQAIETLNQLKSQTHQHEELNDILKALLALKAAK